MELKTNKETVYTVSCSDLDNFFTERFGFEERYTFVAAEEMGNDSSKIINVNKEELSKWDKEDLEKMRTTKQ